MCALSTVCWTHLESAEVRMRWE